MPHLPLNFQYYEIVTQMIKKNIGDYNKFNFED
jgi:hypothetical protein